MIKAKMSYSLPIEYEFSKPVSIHLNRFSVKGITKGMPNILVVLEPYAIRQRMNWMKNSEVLQYKNLFDYIITFDEELLEKCSNAVFWIYGHCSFEGKYEIPEKIFSISSILTSKNETDGHKFRHRIYGMQEAIKIPKNFYVSSRFPVGSNSFNNPEIGKNPNDKLKLFNSQFHLCIENSIEKNYFTEKLIDCLIAKSIPLYYGCSEIDKYFNMNGILKIINTDNVIEDINKLTPDLYEKLYPFIQENYNKALEYADFPLRLKILISSLIDKGETKNAR